MIAILIVCCWILCAPFAYLACRWANRAMGSGWTRNDRLFAIVFSVLYGPVMPFLAVLIVLAYKLETSDWGNKEAGW